MKSIISENNNIKYPCLMIFTKTDEGSFIVLFNSKDCGMVINSENKVYPIGDYSHSWNMLKFTFYTGNVNLTNF
jgi:hypothetical protein